MAVVRLLNSFHSQDHTRVSQHVDFCMIQHIHLLLKAGKSRTDVLKSFKTTALVWESRTYFGLTFFVQISLTVWNVTLMSMAFPSSTRLLALIPHYTSSLQQIVTYFMILVSLTIFCHLISISLVIEHISVLWWF